MMYTSGQAIVLAVAMLGVGFAFGCAWAWATFMDREDRREREQSAAFCAAMESARIAFARELADVDLASESIEIAVVRH